MKLRGSLWIAVVCALAGPSGAQDFHFISTRDSAAGELNFELYRYQGGAETRLSFTPVLEEHPQLAVTKNLIFFAAPGPQGVDEIHVQPLGGGPITQLTVDGDEDPFEGNHHPFLAPDQNSLFITTHRHDGSEIIRRISISGNPIATVVDHGAGVLLGHSPTAVTPAGAKLYYASDTDGDFEIYRSDLDGSNEEQLTSNGLFDSGVAVSPDGTRYAFSRQDPVDSCVTNIFVANHDGTGVTQVTTAALGQKWPFEWDGINTILYASNETGDQRIYSINAAGTGKTTLVNSAGEDMHLLPDPTCGFNMPEIDVAGPESEAVGASAAFSADTAPNLVAYDWDWGDSTSTPGGTDSESHVYTAAGSYQVAVVAKDSCTPPNETIASTEIRILTVALCGNGTLEGGEICDGANLNGESCGSLHAGSGTLQCAGDCASFDLSGCNAGNLMGSLSLLGGGAPPLYPNLHRRFGGGGTATPGLTVPIHGSAFTAALTNVMHPNVQSAWSFANLSASLAPGGGPAAGGTVVNGGPGWNLVAQPGISALGGPIALPGIHSLMVMGLGGPVTQLDFSVPLTGVGASTAASAPYTIGTSVGSGQMGTLQISGLGWTTGVVSASASSASPPTFWKASGFDARTAGGLGTVQLVTPYRITYSDSLGGTTSVTGIGELRLEFVPEPGAGAMLAFGALAAGWLGARRVRRRRAAAG